MRAALIILFGLMVLAVESAPGQQRVVLTNAGQYWNMTPREAAGAWALRLEGVVTAVDATHNLLVLQEGTGAFALRAVGQVAGVRPGQRIRAEADEAWTEVGAFPEYPGNPRSIEFWPSFEMPEPMGKYYVDRVRGWLCPSESGEYHFWISSKGSSELWLSSNSLSSTAEKLAWVPRGSTTRPRQWGKFASQASRGVMLEAGHRYYVEAVCEHVAGNDHLEVAWQGPGLEQDVIDGKYLSLAGGNWDLKPLSLANAPAHGVVREHWTNYVSASVSLLSSRQPADSPLRARGLRLVELGAGKWPEPWKIQPGEPVAAVDNYRWAQCEGRVESVTVEAGCLMLELADEQGARVRVSVNGWGAESVPLWRFGRVRVRGVCCGRVDGSGERLASELWTPNRSLMELVETPDDYWGARTLAPICSLNGANSSVAWGKLVRVRGKVVSASPTSGVVLQSEDSFVGEVSRNGTNWTPVGQPVEVPMDEALLAGLAVTSFDSNVLSTATFNPVVGLPSGPVGADVNSPALQGRSVADGGGFEISGGGAGVGSAWDQFHYYSAPMKSDGAISAQVMALKNPQPKACAGVMMRNSLEPSAPFVELALLASGGVSLIFRQAGSARGESLVVPDYSAPCWLRLTRRHYQMPIRLEAGALPTVGSSVEAVGVLAWDRERPVLQRARCRELASDRLFQPVNVARPPSGPPDLVSIEQVNSDRYDPSGAGAASAVIRGVVTFCERVSQNLVVAVQDDSGAVFVRMASRLQKYPLEFGQMVELECKRFNGKFPRPFEAVAVARLGQGQLPEPVKYPAQTSLPHRGEGLWTDLEGVVVSVNPDGLLMVRAKDELVPVWLGRMDAGQLGSYIDCVVRLRGVMAWHLDPSPMMLVSSASFLEVLESAPNDPFALPTASTSDLASLKEYSLPIRRVKVSGVVTAVRRGDLFLQDSSGGARVLMDGSHEFRVGDRVEAIGFARAQHLGSVVLTGGRGRRLGQGEELVPQVCPTGELLAGNRNAQLVQTHATLLEQRKRREEYVLEMQTAQRVFRATLAVQGGTLGSFRPGSVLQLTGVCWSERGGADGQAVSSPQETALSSFELVLRSPEDVVVVRQPPWWTWKHTAWTVAALLTVLAGALVWIRLLHQRVAERTRELELAMERLEQETKTSATLAERDRLAGEIHDGLEQGLSGIMMQLDGVEAKLSDDPQQARHYLESARHMVRFSRAEVRHSLWNLQSPVLANADLPTALAQIARQMSAGRQTAVTVEVCGSTRPLPTAMEHNFLRICQEVLNNALKHADAKTIQVELRYSEEEVQLSVKDDGRGFVPESVMAGVAGHLGLRNLRTRARRMGGRLNLESAPGRGTLIDVAVPHRVESANQDNNREHEAKE
jgi:signal transduction histidine kinase